MQRVTLAAVLLLCVGAALSRTTSKTKTYTVQTADGPVTVTEEKVTEVVPGGSSSFYKETAWSSEAKTLLGKSKLSEISMSDAAGCLVIVIDRKAVSKGIKKFLIEAINKFPMGTKGMKVAFIEYTGVAKTVVSLNQGWSLQRVIARVQKELTIASKSGASSSGSSSDAVGLQAAYNQLQQYGKATAPRIIILITSGSDSNAAKTKMMRNKLKEEWISLSEVHINTVSETFHVEVEGGGHSGSSSASEQSESALLKSLLKTYATSTVQHYKKIYGEIWEFYIVLKYYRKTYPKTWEKYLRIWFSKKFGSLKKYKQYLSRVLNRTGTVSPELSMKLLYKKRYGKQWQKYFLIWKYKRQYGSKWELHWKEHVFKQKYGARWIVHYKEYLFKKKYGKKWQSHYNLWYLKKYRGSKWRYSWTLWNYMNKYGSTNTKYVYKYMKWYFKKTGGSKAGALYKAWKKKMKGLNSSQIVIRFRWLYYTTIYDKEKAVRKYKYWLYKHKYGKNFKPKYLKWLAKHNHKGNWAKYFRKYTLRAKYGANWRKYYYKQKYGKSWKIKYTRFVYKKKFGKNWQIPYYKWYYYFKYSKAKNVARQKYRKWLVTFQRTLYKKKYGKKWNLIFKKWYANWLKGTSNGRSTGLKPSGGKISVAWYRKRYGRRWRYYYTRAVYRKRYGRRWRFYFNKWSRTVWRKIRPVGGKVNVHTVSWYKAKYGAKWKYFYTRATYRRRYGRRWRLKFNRWKKTVWRTIQLKNKAGRKLNFRKVSKFTRRGRSLNTRFSTKGRTIRTRVSIG